MRFSRKAMRPVAAEPAPTQPPAFLSSSGVCPVCGQTTEFVSPEPWLRDHFICTNCGSIPRERALMVVLDQLHPDWAELAIHESSPSNRGASARIASDCTGYSTSYYFPGVEPGSAAHGSRCENLEALTYSDETFDLVITQDVLEHVFHPDRVFSEIARVLKPGGSHIFTVPITRYREPSLRRARLTDGVVEHLLPAQFHGNPIDDSGALVTIDWGWDICEHIHAASGLFTHVFQIDDLSRGIRAAHLEVFATMKPARPGAPEAL